MGIQDRDYMRRRPDDDDDDDDDDNSGSSSEADAAERLNELLERNSRLVRYAGIALGVIIVIAVIVALVSEGKS